MTGVFLTMLILGSSLSIPPSAADGLREVRLVDQYGAEDRLVDHLGRPVVVIVVTARRLRNLKAWERDLRARFDDLDIVRIADVPADSNASLNDVAERLRERVPDGVSVLIDMDRLWATALALDTSRPNLLLFGPDGALRSAHHGKHDEDLAIEVLADIGRQLDDR